MREAELVIIGAGPAGMGAAVKAREEGIEDIVILERGESCGGILMQCIHNGFGLHYFKEELTGPEYAARFIQMLLEQKIEVKRSTMVLDVSPERVVTAVNEADGVLQIKAKAVVLAMGCRERTRGALNIPGGRPAGILTAGAAQRFVNIEGFMPGREVVILGSGDIGLIMARRMTLEGAKVKAVCELMPFSGGLQRNITQCLDDFGIPLKLSHTVVKIHGQSRLEGVTIAKVDESVRPIQDTYQYIPCDTLLLSVGLIPENELSKKAGVEIDKMTRGPVVDETMETNVEGVFACGNVVHVHDLVDFVTQESQRAGAAAARFIKAGRTERMEPAVTKTGNGISYIVPQRVFLDGSEDKLPLFFRVRDIYKKVQLNVRADGEVVYSVKKAHMAPGEMESLALDRSIFGGKSVKEITIELGGYNA